MESTIAKRLKETEEWLQKEHSSIRTGQAAPGLLDGVRVESYGSVMSLNQMASVGVEDARTLRISVWDNSVIAAIERSIREADLGVSTVTDSTGIRVIFPELTAERRVQLLKLAKNKLEESRIAVRAIRDEAMKTIEKQQKDGELSEDEKFTLKDKIQSLVDKTNQALETQFLKKEAELQK
jgi:ribosome recycling factor